MKGLRSILNVFLLGILFLSISISVSAQNIWSGTGFALNNGYLVTNWHVANGAQTIYVYGIRGDFTKKYVAEVVAKDEIIDLAILKISGNGFPGFGTVPYKVKTNTSEVAEEVFVLGFPMIDVMGDEVKFSVGVINSLSGIEGDKSTYQISAQVSHGSSGGPVFDNYGNLVGIISSGLDAKVQQNVYYAIKTVYLKNLVETMYVDNILPTSSMMGNYTKRKDKFKAVKNFVFYIECYDRKMPLDDVANRPSYLSVSPASLSFNENQEAKTLTISTNAPSWKVVSMPDWCTATDKTATSITINGMNNVSDETRNGIIILETNDGKRCSVSILQSGMEKTTITTKPTSISFGENGGQRSIAISTNSESWEISTKPDWCTIVSKTATSIVVAVSSYENKYARSGSVVFETNDGKTISVQISQSLHSGKLNGYKWVDLGLPSGTKWATCNVGAKEPEDYGGYFAWGETESKGVYSYDTYNFFNNPNILPLNADVATNNWGVGWRMPNKSEFEELKKLCIWEWTAHEGKYGYKITGINGNFIFLPAAGYRYSSDFGYVGINGCYWSSSFKDGNSHEACYLNFNSKNHYIDSYHRYCGQSVRPVCDK